MPLYEYECKQCHKHVEKIQKFSDPEITTCPHCGGELERVISAPAVQFKGGGWYSDLYSSSKPKSGGDTAGSAASSASDKSGASASTSNNSSAGSSSDSTASAPSSTPAASTTSKS